MSTLGVILFTVAQARSGQASVAASLLEELGATHGFRFREVQFDCSMDPEDKPTTVLDGIARVEVRPSGIVVEELASCFERSTSYEPIHKRTVALFSLLSGEQVTASERMCSPPFVYLAYWDRLPEIVFLGGGRALPLPGWTILSATVSLEVLSDQAGQGLRCEVTLSDGCLQRMTFFRHDGAIVRIIRCEEYQERLPGTITDASYQYHAGSSAPCVPRVRIWQRLSGPWAEGPIKDTLPKEAMVIDTRIEPGSSKPSRTDRPLSLEAVATWPTWLGDTNDPIVVVDSDAEGQPNSGQSLYSLPLLCGIGCIVAALVLLMVKAKRRRAALPALLIWIPIGFPQEQNDSKFDALDALALSRAGMTIGEHVHRSDCRGSRIRWDVGHDNGVEAYVRSAFVLSQCDAFTRRLIVDPCACLDEGLRSAAFAIGQSTISIVPSTLLLTAGDRPGVAVGSVSVRTEAAATISAIRTACGLTVAGGEQSFALQQDADRKLAFEWDLHSPIDISQYAVWLETGHGGTIGIPIELSADCLPYSCQPGAVEFGGDSHTATVVCMPKAKKEFVLHVTSHPACVAVHTEAVSSQTQATVHVTEGELGLAQ